MSVTFSIDGLEWDVPCEIERISEVKASEIAGFMMDGSYCNDVMGTYLRFEIRMLCPENMKAEYDQIYSKLVEPVDGHQFFLPYAQDQIQVTARVESVKDVPYEMPDGTYWGGTRFSVISNHPVAQMSLDEMLTRGRAPLPDLSAGEIGDAWTYTSSGWEHQHYASADDVYY